MQRNTATITALARQQAAYHGDVDDLDDGMDREDEDLPEGMAPFDPDIPGYAQLGDEQGDDADKWLRQRRAA